MKRALFVIMFCCSVAVGLKSQSNYQLYYPVNASATISQSDTIFLLPGQYFNVQYSFKDLNNYSQVFGFKLEAKYYGFNSPNNNYWFHWQSSFLGSAVSGNCYGGNYQTQYGASSSQFWWQSSTNYINGAYLGLFEGRACGFNLNQSYKYNLKLEVQELGPGYVPVSHYLNLSPVFMVVDGIRGDVNDDGAVTEDDQLLLISYLHNFPAHLWSSYSGAYKQSGLNYFRGLLPTEEIPSYMSICIQNAWVYFQNDPWIGPMFAGLGIGEAMSTTACGFKDAQSNLNFKATINGNFVTLSAQGRKVIINLLDEGVAKHQVITESSVDIVLLPDASLLQVSSGKLQLYNLSGQLIASGGTQLSLTAIVPGVYVAVWRDGRKVLMTKKIVR